MPCAFCLYMPTLLKIVSHYYFSGLSMSVMGFQNMWTGGGGGVKLGPSSFFIIIRRCDIGVVLHLLGQFAKNRSRCIFIDGSITPCLWGWDSHTPNRRINRFIFEDCVWAQSKPWYRLWSPLSFHCYVNFFIKI